MLGLRLAIYIHLGSVLLAKGHPYDDLLLGVEHLPLLAPLVRLGVIQTREKWDELRSFLESAR